ncbi:MULTISPECIES: KamA family radical SAM protein [unclassified Thermosipho (in: thermotogales)]|uniref:KamA family radical SAM protein n=1 Tax=unclassified Thermosipho (in: thermotogales) TaxID=2676525 RepID=UPI000985A909|nr:MULTISPECIES: KamA family radical SAM protein [unclassified Thermosipho (in: thermotogales)]MBT1248074.1 radical SAM protein [Thermosipho sp. 1244]OOC46665.1 radical SAM protein [Thermosipho sp. 1223]
MPVKYIIDISKVDQLTDKEKKELKRVTEKYKFRTNDYYLNLINWEDPNDPIRKLIIPQISELEEWGRLDASNEKSYTISKGLQHKYRDTALLLVNDVCGGFCRFCFRKRLFINIGEEVARDVTEDLEYIKSHKEITNVLLTGGDPLLLSTKKLEKIISRIREIEHVKIIRIGSKMVAFNPYRIIEDPELIELIKKYSTDEKKIYIMTQFNHPRELTEPAIKAVNMLLKAGAILANQTPLIKGVNADWKTLMELFQKLSFIGIPPYYVFQGRPVSGNKPFAVPVEEGYQIFLKAIMNVSGLAKRARFVMSHETGKIEVSALTDEHIIFRYQRAHNPKDAGKIMVFKRNPNAYWFDDYKELVTEYIVENPIY